MSRTFIKPTRSKVIRYLKSYAPFWQKKKIGFYANFGHGDLGDDACFVAANDLPLSKRCFAFNPRSLSAFLIGGCAVLRWESPYIPRRIFNKKKWDFPVILFSAGINQDYNKEFSAEARDKIKRLCAICDYITVKDRLTQDFIKSLGFSEVSILPALELVLKEKDRNFNFKKRRFTVGIVLTPHSEFDEADFKKLRDIFCKFSDHVTAGDRDIVFLRFERDYSESKKESYLINEIMSRVKKKDRVRVLEEDLEPKEMLYFMKRYCDAMICTRLHSAVFSVKASIPFLCISYNLMHKGFFEMVESPDLEISISDEFSFENLKDKFEYVIKNYDSIRSRLAEKKDYLKGLIHKEISYIKEKFKLN